MRSFLTLIWEQWRQTWRGLALISAALLGYWASLVLVEQLVLIVFSSNARIAIAVAYLPVAGAIGLLFMQESRSQIGFAYPERMFWLPVHTYTLIGAQFVYKLVIVTLMSLAAGWICATEIKLTFAIMPQVVLFASLTATLVGVVFLMSGYGSGTGLALFLPAAAISTIGFLPLYRAVSHNFGVPMPPSAWVLLQFELTPETAYHLYVFPEFSVWTWWGGAATLVWWAVVSYIAARHARSEVPGDRIGRWVRMVSNVAYLDRESGGFSSPEAAQRWFEWRRVVYLYPWITVVLGLLMVATLRTSASEAENKFVVGLSLLMIAPAIAAALIGYSMTRPDPGYMWFVGGRPLTTSTISRVRLMVSIKAIAMGYLLSFVAYTIANVVLFGSWNPIDSLVTDMQLITSTYGTLGNPFLMLAGAFWIVLMVVWTLFWLGRSAGVIAWISGLLAMAYFYMSGSSALEIQGHIVVSPISIMFTGTLTVLMACSVLAVFAWAVRGGLLSIKVLPILAGFLVLSIASIYVFRDAMGSATPLTAIAVGVFVPLLPFASVPATLAWQRYR